MTLSALDENGNPVDWWFAYKIAEQMSNHQETAGLQTAYP
jgi:hypothetical protein